MRYAKRTKEKMKTTEKKIAVEVEELEKPETLQERIEKSIEKQFRSLRW